MERGRDGAAQLPLWIGIVLGIGLVGSLDEIVFHQLLQWHNFYVDTTERWRIISDGLFHLFTAVALFFGATQLWRYRSDLARHGNTRTLISGLLLGGGGFNLFDGTINHKLLQLHPVREGVGNIWVYDLIWIGSSLLLMLAGWLLYREAPHDTAAPLGRRTRDHA